ncbi:hypothetical protein [Chryseobacterium sp.]|uniref:hypothetical protein n=1 Tax=Chryseobacterium sp. TaxID=1871047 RepID=UPI00260F485A|nr:hypothetical protein [Chryseobacterium sp.]
MEHYPYYSKSPIIGFTCVRKWTISKEQQTYPEITASATKRLSLFANSDSLSDIKMN